MEIDVNRQPTLDERRLSTEHRTGPPHRLSRSVAYETIVGQFRPRRTHPDLATRIQVISRLQLSTMCRETYLVRQNGDKLASHPPGSLI